MKKVFHLILFLCISTLITSTAAFANDEVSDLIKDTTKNIGGNSCISKNLDTISSNYTVSISTSTSALQTAEFLLATPPLPEAGEITSREEKCLSHFEQENTFNEVDIAEVNISLSQKNTFNEKDLKVKEKNSAQKKLGLALSGGGALGFAHIGAIQALEEHGIKPDYISGSSMGAIIGVIYCAGYTPTEIMKVIKDEKLYKLEKLMSPKISLKRQGLSSHATLRTTLQEMLPHDCFDSLKIPFTVCVTNITSGKSEYYFSGKGLINWVVASASIPGVFEPVFVNDTAYVDGGVLNNLPAEALHNRGCDYIIGVDVLPFLDVQKSSIMDIALWSIRLMQHSNTIDDSKYCNWLITSNAIKSYNEFDFDKYKEIYQYGYKAMTDYIHSHPEMVETLTGKPTEHHHPATINTSKKIEK